MILGGIEEHDVLAALEVANTLYNGNLTFKKGTPEPIAAYQRSWRVLLEVKDVKLPGCQRGSSVFSGRLRTIRSACLHAHRDYLLAAYERAPHMRVSTATVRYENALHFEQSYPSTGDRLVPVSFMRTTYTCNCWEFGDPRERTTDICLGAWSIEVGEVPRGGRR